jgi:hypothetical protein
MFYIICTNVQHKRELPIEKSIFSNFILTTRDIWADEWSDPVFFDFHGIDTSIFWEDGRAYIIGSRSPEKPSASTEIYQFEINLVTGHKLSEEKLLWQGITKVFPEGPHMYKRDGWYYLLIAEGGCFAGHHTIMARSRNIWGPFEENPQNPVLGKTDPASDYVQYTGHGDLFQDSCTGKWYFCCLGVRKDRAGRAIMGRETFLTTASWPKDEFPVIDPVKLELVLPGSDLSLHLPQIAQKSPRCFTPAVDVLHIRNPAARSYQYQGHRIALTASEGGLEQGDEPVTFLGKRQRQLAGVSHAKLRLDSIATGSALGPLQTGLCYYKDEHRLSRIFLDLGSKEVIWHTLNKARSQERRCSVSIGDFAAAAELVLGVSYTEASLEFWFSLQTGVSDGERRTVGTMDTLDLTADEFVGPIIGIFATGAEGTQVVFTDFQVD